MGSAGGPESSSSSGYGGSENEGHARVMKRLSHLFDSTSRSTGYTTGEVLSKFSDLDDGYASVFREMLREIATKKGDRWVRKVE